MSFTSITYNPRIIKPMVIHLIGFQKMVNQASKEIQNFADQEYLDSTIISNDKLTLLCELQKSNIIINKCNLLTCNEVNNLHCFVKVSSLYSYNSFALLVTSKSKYKYEDKMKKCIDITELYDIYDFHINKKDLVTKYFLEL